MYVIQALRKMLNQLFNALSGLRRNLSVIMQPMLLFESLSFSLRDLPLRSCPDLVIHIGFVAHEHEQCVLQACLHIFDPYSLQVTQRLRAVIIKKRYQLTC